MTDTPSSTPPTEKNPMEPKQGRRELHPEAVPAPMTDERLAEVVAAIRKHFRSIPRSVGEPLLNAFTELEYEVVVRLRSLPAGSPTTTPAMPPEEWRAQLARTPEKRRRHLGWARDEADADGYLTIHGLAALALYGQPFGFTQEDVDTLDVIHGMALRAVEECGDLVDATAPPRAVKVIEKIEALLPPPDVLK